MKPILSCRLSVYENSDVAFGLLPEAGIRHVELPFMPADEIREAVDRVQAAGLTVATAAAQLKSHEDAGLEQTCRILEAARIRRHSYGHLGVIPTVDRSSQPQIVHVPVLGDLEAHRVRR